jgi:hypothetical protein
MNTKFFQVDFAVIQYVLNKRAKYLNEIIFCGKKV